jgi:hypothetical protein
VRRHLRQIEVARFLDRLAAIERLQHRQIARFSCSSRAMR